MVWRRTVMGMGLVVACATTVFGQSADTPYQIRAIANLKPHDTIVISNSGASSTQPSPQNGALCANIYALSATSGLLVECCSCRVAPNAMASIGIVSDILGNPKKRPKSIVLKVMGSTGNSDVCNPGTVATGPDVLATGMLLWKDQIPFTPSTLSAAELSHLNSQCAGLHATGNICPVCQPQ